MGYYNWHAKRMTREGRRAVSQRCYYQDSGDEEVWIRSPDLIGGLLSAGTPRDFSQTG